VLAVMSGEVVVPIACRLAGVVLPPLPRTAEELEEGVEALPAQAVLTRAAHIDEYVTALLAGASLLAVPAAAATAGRGGWATALALVACGSALLRVRVFGGRGQRVAWLATGLAGPSTVVVAAGLGGGPVTRGWLVVGLLMSGAALLAGALVLPGRRAVPRLGRTAEILEGLTAAALLPLLLAVLGTYSAARNLW
jgi:type VII secretion integral membrane protein EccD